MGTVLIMTDWRGNNNIVSSLSKVAFSFCFALRLVGQPDQITFGGESQQPLKLHQRPETGEVTFHSAPPSSPHAVSRLQPKGVCTQQRWGTPRPVSEQSGWEAAAISEAFLWWIVSKGWKIRKAEERQTKVCGPVEESAIGVTSAIQRVCSRFRPCLRVKQTKHSQKWEGGCCWSWIRVWP